MLYYFILAGNIPFACRVMYISYIHPMLKWVPIKNDLSYWHSTVDEETTTFRLIWFTSHSMIGFIGLFSIILMFFYLLDMLFTWKHPIKYMSQQKHIIPIFLTGAKIGQVVFYFIFEKHIRTVNMTVVVCQFALSIILLIAVVCRYCSN